MPKLKDPRHELFCQNRAVGQTCDAAYTNAGYKPNRGNAARLNANESIQARIGELTDNAVRKTERSLEEDYLELESLAHSNLADFFTLDADGLPEITFDGVTRQQTAALADLTVDTINGKDGDKSCVIGRRVKLKLADKAGALVKLIELKQKARDREEERAALEAKTLDATVVEDDDRDYLADLADRFRLPSLELVKAAKKSGDYSALTGRANGKTKGNGSGSGS